MINILIVENDCSLQKILLEVLASNIRNITVTSTISKASELLEKNIYQLLILDRNLDDGDGLEVLEYILDISPQTKVMILSQKNQLPDRITGLERGADDYLGKPFSLAELKLKTKKLLSFKKMTEQKSIGTSQFNIDMSTGIVTCSDQTYKLRKKEAEILSYLMENKNQIVNRNDIIWAVWEAKGENVPSSATLDVYIRRIRMSLFENKNAIETIRGFGYKFKAQN